MNSILSTGYDYAKAAFTYAGSKAVGCLTAEGANVAFEAIAKRSFGYSAGLPAGYATAIYLAAQGADVVAKRYLWKKETCSAQQSKKITATDPSFLEKVCAKLSGCYGMFKQVVPVAVVTGSAYLVSRYSRLNFTFTVNHVVAGTVAATVAIVAAAKAAGVGSTGGSGGNPDLPKTTKNRPPVSFDQNNKTDPLKNNNNNNNNMDPNDINNNNNNNT